MICFFIIGMFEEINLLAGYGLCYSALMLLNSQWLTSLSFCACMLNSEHLGARNFREFRLTYYRSIGMGCFIGMISILLFMRLDVILTSIGFSAEASSIAWIGILCLIPYALIQNFDENLRSYMIVQSFDKVFTITNAIEILGGSFLAWLFIWYLQFGIIGVGISRGITEAITCIVLLTTWKIYGMKESFYAGETLREIFCTKYFADFARFFAGNTMPLMAAYIAFEAFTIEYGVYGHTDLVSAWVVLQSLITTLVMVGFGFADTANVYVGYQIGQGCNKFAKKLASWNVCLHWLGMMWYPLGLIVFHNQVAGWFTHIPDVHSVLSLWIFVYGFFGLFNSIIFTIAAMTRLAGQIYF
jgi:Na+-driven multidrug efflux pump